MKTKSIYNFKWKDNKEYYLGCPLLAIAINSISGCGTTNTFVSIVLALFIVVFIGLPLIKYCKEKQRWK